MLLQLLFIPREIFWCENSRLNLFFHRIHSSRVFPFHNLYEFVIFYLFFISFYLRQSFSWDAERFVGCVTLSRFGGFWYHHNEDLCMTSKRWRWIINIKQECLKKKHSLVMTQFSISKYLHSTKMPYIRISNWIRDRFYYPKFHHKFPIKIQGLERGNFPILFQNNRNFNF